jgi:hypothetical protein
MTDGRFGESGRTRIRWWLKVEGILDSDGSDDNDFRIGLLLVTWNFVVCLGTPPPSAIWYKLLIDSGLHVHQVTLHRLTWGQTWSDQCSELNSVWCRKFECFKRCSQSFRWLWELWYRSHDSHFCGTTIGVYEDYFIGINAINGNQISNENLIWTCVLSSRVSKQRKSDNRKWRRIIQHEFGCFCWKRMCLVLQQKRMFYGRH